MKIRREEFPVMPPPEPLPDTLDKALKKFEGYPVDEHTRAHVRHTVRNWFLAQGEEVPEFAVVMEHHNMAVILAPELPMEAAEFEHRTGYPPQMGDLDRVNCDVVGEIGHWNCGWCLQHDGPQGACMCAYHARAEEVTHVS